MSDEFLMLSVKNGDLDKAAIIYGRYKKKLYQFFFHRNYGDKEASADHVQQVFYRLIKYRNSYKEEASFNTWLYSIASNIRYQDIKEKQRMNVGLTDYKIPESYDHINDEHQALHQALKTLPETHREILMMSKFLDMKYDEIATINGCSVGVVKTRVFRAMQALRETYFKINQL
ncbi:MAG: sigma-70 family RNA polymerase sigma factor [Mucilaginibacter sp.]